jgi:hypothetical protein
MSYMALLYTSVRDSNSDSDPKHESSDAMDHCFIMRKHSPGVGTVSVKKVINAFTQVVITDQQCIRWQKPNQQYLHSLNLVEVSNCQS